MQGKKTGRCGFTLIELLVVIGVIAILVGLLVPALAKAKQLGRSLKEQSAAHQQIVAYGSYVVDMRDATLPGAPHWAWNHTPRVQYGMYPADPWEKGKYLEGSITKVWTWHFVGATGYKHDLLQLDGPTYSDFFTRPSSPTGTAQFNNYAANTYAAAVGWHPSLGYNGVFIGGAYTHGAFRGIRDCNQAFCGFGGTYGGMHSPYGHSTPAPNPRVSGGLFYLAKAGDVKYPSSLITFGSARGGDVKNSASYWGYGETTPVPAQMSQMVRGNWLIAPPRPHPTTRGGYQQVTQLGMGWQRANATSKANAFDPRSTAVGNWGMVDFRWQNKTTTAMFDGSVRLQNVEELDDMRKWSNHATSWDWTFQPF